MTRVTTEQLDALEAAEVEDAAMRIQMREFADYVPLRRAFPVIADWCAEHADKAAPALVAEVRRLREALSDLVTLETFSDEPLRSIGKIAREALEGGA